MSDDDLDMQDFDDFDGDTMDEEDIEEEIFNDDKQARSRRASWKRSTTFRCRCRPCSASRPCRSASF